jgi:hypothetical protein
LTKFEILDGGNGNVEPVVLETWELYGCYLKGADYGSMNYGESAPVTISMTIAYDNAALFQGDNVSAASIGGVLGAVTRNATGSVTGAGAA